MWKIEKYRHADKILGSLLLTRQYISLFLIPIVMMLFFITFFDNCAVAKLQDDQSKVSITVNYANDTSIPYTALAAIHQKYTISQRYSWADNNHGRFNLQAYSIDNGPVVAIKRTSDGNFTLDMLADSNHSLVFFAKPQFEIIITGTPMPTFLPVSPTNDSWFDIDSDVQFVVPYVVSTDIEGMRQQLGGWSFDSPDINVISRQESGSFKSPVIHMSNTHRIDLEYKTQYYIKVISDFGRPLGTGWYDFGAIVNVGVTPGNDILVRHVFTGWQGSIIGNGNQDSASTLSDSPKVLVANWFVDYTNVSIIGIIVIAVLVLLAIYHKRKTPQGRG